ncbi:TetR-like C-terminal domain-containing protein [Marvinbryantia formatexigens]|nr:TetR-like C-terminal domain-containing protein [Marvinbryantia formatexigens]UWO23813.1 TetR/AcrR family transcriptional regulator [Marvinbryantia formatexigens DSM 14469]SDF72014.1 transcriptional regulator, TetR family [Marvinbryantia formatexigens]
MSQLTERAIEKSFIRLLNEVPFDKITVKDIVEDCGINRNTFYYHYEDIFDLLHKVFEKRAAEVLAEGIAQNDWQESFLRCTLYALENRREIYHIYNSVDRCQLERFLYNVAGEIMLSYVRAQAEGMQVSVDDIGTIADFYKCALVGIVLEWLDGGMKQEPEEFIRRVGFLQEGSIARMLARAAQESGAQQQSGA